MIFLDLFLKLEGLGSVLQHNYKLKINKEKQAHITVK